MKQSRQEDVHVAVPETGCHDEALAIDDRRAVWNLDLCSRSNRSNSTAMREDCAAFDWWFRWGEINLCTNQGQVGGMAVVSHKKCQKQEKS